MQLIVRYCIAALLVSVCTISTAAPELSETFDVLWEMQWQQSGYPLNANKWDLSKERKLTYSINATASKSSVEYVQEAVGMVAGASDIEFVQVYAKDGKAQIEFLMRRFSDEELRASTCFAQPLEKAFRIYSAKVTVSEQYSYRCILHELMHAMGLMGHPMGDTVLTYFGGYRNKLSAIDRFVLKHWNDLAITPGMNIFRATKALNRIWIFENVPLELQPQAIDDETAWFAKTIAQMDAFADGKGEPPRILYRSGRLNESGMAISRNVIQGILGTAYLEGFGVEKNAARAYVLLFRGAQALQFGAINALERGLVQEKFAGVDVKPACTWLKDRLILNNRLDLVKLNQARYAKSCGDAFVAP